jgi:outer membrane protein OmpA-like peptidoglycan-associated protein
MSQRMFPALLLPAILFFSASVQAADWSLEHYSTDKGVIALQNSAKQSDKFVIEQAADITFRNFLLLKDNQLKRKDWHLRPSPFRGFWGNKDLLGDQISALTQPQAVLVEQSPKPPMGTEALVVRFNFSKGSSNLSAQDKQELAHFAQGLAVYFQREPTFGLLIEGHTDSDPFVSDKGIDNQYLSELRAAAVVREIAYQLNQYADRMMSTGYAAKQKIFVAGKEDKTSSRRVEIKALVVEPNL